MKEEFEKLLELHGITEEFCIEMREFGKYATIAELCNKVDDPSEYIAEAFNWFCRLHWLSLDHDWRIACGTKRRFKDEELGYGM